MKRNILITGASSGIGYQAILKLLKFGHKIIAPCRNKQKSQKTLLRLKKEISVDSDISFQIDLPVLDLSNLNDIRNFTNNLLLEGREIDTLILNAGLQYTGAKNPEWSSDGFEITFAVNHLSHQYIAESLIPLLLKSTSPRVIITSSEVHNPKSPGGQVGEKATLGKLEGIKSGKGFKMIDGCKEFNADKAYKDSKLCNILFAKELFRNLKEDGHNIPVIAWAPGLVIPKTREGFFRYSRQYNELGQRIFAFIARDILRITESPENAGRILAYLAQHPNFSKSSFLYMSNRILRPGKKIFEDTEVSDEASNDKIAKELCDLSRDLISI